MVDYMWIESLTLLLVIIPISALACNSMPPHLGTAAAVHVGYRMRGVMVDLRVAHGAHGK